MSQSMSESHTVHRGLRGITVAETNLSLIDGKQGRLLFRGYDAPRLALERSFEEIAFLLWHGRLPGDQELADLRSRWAAHRPLPPHAAQVLAAIPGDVDMMSALRTVVSALGAPGHGFPPTVEQAEALTAVVPTIVAARHRRLEDLQPVEPAADLGHAANALYMLTGERPPSAHEQALDAYLAMTAEHGLNASTFAARVTTSTESDLVSAVTSAVGTMKGPLHGGAPHAVSRMLGEIGSPDRAENYLRDVLESGGRIMGFGHRVYRTTDPRATALSELTRRLAPEDPWLDLATRVEDTAVRLLAEYKPGRRLHTNVEFYAAAVLRAVGMPPELYTAVFSAARMAGWTAHALEQSADNELIRPRAAYVGPRACGT